MKKIITIIPFLAFSMAFSQINVGRSVSPTNLYVNKHEKVLFDNLKKTKTIFVVPENLENTNFKTVISDLWTFNDLSFISYSEFEEKPEDYLLTTNSIIELIDNGYEKQKTGGIMGAQTRTVATYIVFKFRMQSSFRDLKRNKKDKLEYASTNVAEIFFTPTIKYRQDISTKIILGNPNKKHNEKRGFYNYNLGYIKNYFQELNRRLNDSENLVIDDGILKEEKLQHLKDKTLYAPEWILKKYNAMAASWGKTRTKEKLFGKYDYSYDVIDNETLNTKILNGEDFYYLTHTQFNQNKVVSIIHSLTGEIIYLDKTSVSYNIKNGDLKSISEYIK